MIFSRITDVPKKRAHASFRPNVFKLLYNSTYFGEVLQPVLYVHYSAAIFGVVR